MHCRLQSGAGGPLSRSPYFMCPLSPPPPQVVYFNFSRGVMVDTMDQRHIQATEHLRGAREYGLKMAKEREDKAPTLTAEQKEQLHEYLKLLRESQPDVYPKESRRWE